MSDLGKVRTPSARNLWWSAAGRASPGVISPPPAAHGRAHAAIEMGLRGPVGGRGGRGGPIFSGSGRSRRQWGRSAGARDGSVGSWRASHRIGVSQIAKLRAFDTAVTGPNPEVREIGTSRGVRKPGSRALGLPRSASPSGSRSQGDPNRASGERRVQRAPHQPFRPVVPSLSAPEDLPSATAPKRPVQWLGWRRLR